MTTETIPFEDEDERQAHDAPLIRAIQVTKLFGRYTYDIRVRASTAPRIILLYGDNGGGKTTILNMLWHLLSPAPDRKHRTKLAQTPFQSFSVTLSNGDTISAVKRSGLIGDFEIHVARGSKIICRQGYPTDIHGVVKSQVHWRQVHERIKFTGDDAQEVMAEIEADIPEFKVDPDRYIDYLKKVKIDPYFLADDRRMYSDSLSDDADRRRTGFRHQILLEDRLQRYEGSSLANELSEALRRTNNWLRQQIISGAAEGSQGADAIYLEVLSQLVGTSRINNEEPSLDEIKKRLSELDARTKQFNEFGLAPHVRADPFIELLDNVQGSRRSLIEDVLTPYLDGQRARLDSLQPMESLIRTFVETVNGFFVNKMLSYSLRRGLRIRVTDTGSVLEPEQLSSGERQLLLLLCNSLLSRAEGTLFIIDEPEISLNAKWQRKLISALLACVQSSGVQFVLATHSVEIITGHREFLAQLRTRTRS